jgi:excisionase family DNA binding protein
MSRYPSLTPEPSSARSTEPPTPAPKRSTPAKAVPRLLSTTAAAAYLGVSANTIRKYRDDGKIRAFHVGERLVKYDPEDLDRFMREFNNS